MARITIKDIARESGVSTATVSRVLNNTGYASKEIRDKVRFVAKKLNYQPNAIARSLKMEKTNTIGILIPDITNSYFMQIAKGIEDTLEKEGYNLLFASGDEDVNKEKKVLKVLMEKRVDAIVLATSGEDQETINMVNHANIPVVLIDRKLESDCLNLDLVVEDNIAGAYQLTKYLIEQGHKKIGVVNGLLNVSTGRERYLGYKKAMKEFNLEIDESMEYHGDFSEENGRNAASYFLYKLEKPTAILSFNNKMTFGVLLELIKLGYSIPKDFVVASYGFVDAAQLLRPSGIIYVEQFPYEMGIRAGEILIDRLIHKLDQPTHKKFTPKLKIT